MTPARLDTVRYYLGRLGLPGLAGVALLAVSGMLWSSVLQPKAAALAALAADNAQQRQRSAAAHSQPADLAVATQPPHVAEAEAALRRLYTAAGQSGFTLKAGEYRLVPVTAAKLDRYQLALPLQVGYPALRSFLVRALNQEPALALTALHLEREAIEAVELRAMLNFTLFLEGSP